MAQMTWTAEQVASLAPDAASLKAGRQLAMATQWQTLGQDDVALWGEIKGSGARPYQVGVDVAGPAFKCSCPSRKFPCKHALGLSLLFAASPTALTCTAPPEWVTAWHQQRQQRATQVATRGEKAAEPVSEATRQKRAAAQAKRATERQTHVAAGVAELQQRLRDVVRQGLAAHAEHSYRVWDGVAKRLIDAQAPGLARLARLLAPLPRQGEGWQGRMLTRLGQLHLLVQAFQRLDSLPAASQADVRSLVGLTPSREAVLAEEGLHDTWWVLGRQVTHEDSLRVQRSWLYGATSQRRALLLHFATGTQPFEMTLRPGDGLEAEMVWYPSAWPLRGLLKTPPRVVPVAADALTASFQPMATAIRGYSVALARLPWLERYPLALSQVLPWCQAERWWVSDAQQQALPLAPRFAEGWRLLALSGGHPLDVFGEWDGEYLWPLSAWAEGELLLLAERSVIETAGEATEDMYEDLD